MSDEWLESHNPPKRNGSVPTQQLPLFEIEVDPESAEPGHEVEPPPSRIRGPIEEPSHQTSRAIRAEKRWRAENKTTTQGVSDKERLISRSSAMLRMPISPSFATHMVSNQPDPWTRFERSLREQRRGFEHVIVQQPEPSMALDTRSPKEIFLFAVSGFLSLLGLIVFCIRETGASPQFLLCVFGVIVFGLVSNYNHIQVKRTTGTNGPSSITDALKIFLEACRSLVHWIFPG